MSSGDTKYIPYPNLEHLYRAVHILRQNDLESLIEALIIEEYQRHKKISINE